MFLVCHDNRAWDWAEGTKCHRATPIGCGRGHGLGGGKEFVVLLKGAEREASTCLYSALLPGVVRTIFHARTHAHRRAHTHTYTYIERDVCACLCISLYR